MIPIVTWTHTSCSDIWPIYFGQMEKFYNSKHYVFVNRHSDKIANKYIQVINNEDDYFYKRMLSCLEKVEEKYIILSLEDFLLYSNPDLKEITRAHEFMIDNNGTCMRLVKSGCLAGSPVEDQIFSIPPYDQYLISWQPSIWNVDNLKKLIKYFRPRTFGCFEKHGSGTMASLNYTSFYYYNNSRKRGKIHFDSDIYPYAQAVREGKWCIDEWPIILPRMLKEYSINTSKRGSYKNEK